MVVALGLYCCDVMALSGVSKVMSTERARYRRFPLTRCMNLFPS